MDKKSKISDYVDKVNNIADKVLAPETDEVVVKKTVHDLADEIDLYSDVEPAGNDSALLSEPEIDFDIESPIVISRDKITYSAEDKKRLLHELGADIDADSLSPRKRADAGNYEKRIEPLELAKKEFEMKQLETEKQKKPKKRVRRRRQADPETIRARKSMAVIALVVLAALYVTCFFYVRAVNAADVEAAEKALLSMKTEQLINITKTDSTVSASDKEKYDLSVYKLDTDEDGLTDYYELLYSGTAPAKPDTDGDGVPDGVELLSETDPLNPLSDKSTADADRTFVHSLTEDEVTVRLEGKWEIYNSSLAKYPMNVENYPGILTTGVEITIDENTGYLYYDLAKVNINKWGENPDLRIFSYNPIDNSFSLSGNGGTVSDDGSNISTGIKSGIYFLADRNFLTADSGVNIMFVIDNSGSMYPQEIVTGSEENDLEFKRLDFAKGLIEHIGNEVNFGVAKFTLRYTTLSPISDDDEAALAALESIRTGTESFDGTEISNSIISAVDSFKDNKSDRNYIIAITDGLPTNANEAAEERAIAYAKENNISVITIGLGKKIDPEFLSRIAEETGGVYYQAVNNGTFESISEKIETLINSGRTEFIPLPAPAAEETEGEETEAVTVTDDVGVIVLADSGFVVREDTLNTRDVPTSYDIYGSDLGLSIFASKYYSGTLPQKTETYVTNSNVEISGYDLSNSEFYNSGKQNLSDLTLPDTLIYDAYKHVTDRWNFDRITDGILPLSNKSLSALKLLEGRYQIYTAEYDWGGRRDIPGFLRRVTFQPQRVFTTYEYPVLDIDALDRGSDEYRTYLAVNYYNNFADKGGVAWLSFGVDGTDAFNELLSELTLGIPSVLIADGKSLIAAKLSRSQTDTNEYIIEAYDPTDSSLTPTYINLKATELLFNTMPYQYTASISGEPVNLYILKIQGE
ncbi:MAG: VWA domain-containing protein [Ruminococcus sp.]|jgi:hypothetical protein|nr:VWA domain-containing protein [Ruminococcus sp.]